MRISIWLQILLVVFFLALTVLSTPRLFDNSNDIQGPLVRILLLYGLFVAFFYIHYYVILDRFFYRKRYVSYGLIVLASFTLILWFPELIKYIFGGWELKPPTHNGGNHMGFPRRPPFWMEYPRHFFLFASTLLLGHFIRTNQRLNATKQEKIHAELSFLKAQVNPHFLFNTLNSIYSLSLSKSEKTPDAVLQLSAMMRHVLIDSQAERIALQRELDYVSNYVALQRLRMENTVRLTFKITGDSRGNEIAPLLLIPFIENAFKYGVNPEVKSEINIEIKTDEHLLTMKVNNRKVGVVIREEERTGVGLQNVQNRLNLLYPNKHMLKITEDSNMFAVTLTIELE